MTYSEPCSPSHSPIYPRRYDIDALRVLAFGTLILYHVGMFYVADWHWHVKSRYTAESLQAVMLLVNPWRMPLIFLISGVASFFLMQKIGPSGFARARIWRLVLPLLFGMVVIVPPQAFLQALTNGSFEGNYGQFLWDYFRFQPWSPRAFDGSDIGITWNHLWYLPYLLTYSLLLLLMLPLRRLPVCDAIVRRFQKLSGWRLLIATALPFVVYESFLNDRYPATFAWYNDWGSHAIYFTAFTLGYVIANADSLWRELQRLRWLTLVVAVCFYLMHFHFGLYDLLPSPVENTVRIVLGTYNGWFWLLAVLGWGHHFLNRSFRWLPYANEAVFSWYILHQTITIIAGAMLTQYQIGPVLEPILVILLTVAGCAAIHEFIVRRSNLLRPLFGLKPLSVIVKRSRNKGNSFAG